MNKEFIPNQKVEDSLLKHLKDSNGFEIENVDYSANEMRDEYMRKTEIGIELYRFHEKLMIARKELD